MKKGIRKIIAIITVLTLVFQILIPILPILAVDETIADLEISTKEELIAFADDVNNGNRYEGKTVVLMADIDLEGNANNQWTPIGIDNNYSFGGVFDGKNHTIKGIYIDSNQKYLGLFGNVYAGEIRNLKIESGTIIGNENSTYIGGIVGDMSSYVSGYTSILENCHNLSVNIQSNATETLNSAYIGGICGDFGSEGSVKQCSNKARIKTNVAASVGGIIGNFSGFFKAELCESFNRGDISNSGIASYNNAGIGGIVGSLSGDVKIDSSFNAGKIDGDMTVGGIVGSFFKVDTNSKVISSCYNIGSITGNSECGSIIGANGAYIVDSKGGEITNCYYLSGTAQNAYGINRGGTVSAVSKSQSDMKTLNFITQLNNGGENYTQDIENINNGYPILTWMLDKTAPIIDVKYSTQDPTNGDVTVTITSNEQVQGIDGWELSEDKLNLTKAYNQNITETIIIRDLVGNETQADIEITNIDKTTPSINIEYSTKNPTKENVTVTITSNEEMQGISGWALTNKKILTKQYSANTKETITVKDLAGNEVKVNIEITNIDKMGPSCYVEYSTRVLTKDNVMVTIMANEQIEEVTGWTLSSDKMKLTKEYEQNTNQIITIKDLAGNEEKVNVKITNIDKTGPSVSIGYNTKNPTKENVIVTITSNEEVQAIQGWTLSSDEKTLTKEYSANTTETITIKDLVGNETQANISISNIDKIEPSVSIGYNTKNPTKENVIVTITSNEEIQAIQGWTLSSDKKTLTKEYMENTTETITVKDLAGNETQANISISNIDKTGPSVSIGYSTKNPTKENVKVTITSNEEMQTVQGWILSSDKKTLTREYTENTTETITVKDLAGNETKVDIEITNIDKTIVEITIGDMNQDGKVDVTDFLMLKRHLVAGNKTDWVLTGNSLEAADMNENGTVDITDMLMLKRVIVEDM